MRLELLRQGKRRRRGEDLVERTRRVGIEIILHEAAGLYLWVVAGKQRLHKIGVIHGGSAVSHFHIAEASLRLKGAEHTARAVLVVCIMIALGLARAHGQEASDGCNEGTRYIITTEHGMPRVIGQVVLGQHVFHMPEVVARNLPTAPRLT